MTEREVPSTDHDLLVRVWTILEGTNGSGLITRFSCLERDVSDIKRTIPDLWTKEEHNESVANQDKKDERRHMTGRDWTLIVMTILGPIAAVFFAVWIK